MWQFWDDSWFLQASWDQVVCGGNIADVMDVNLGATGKYFWKESIFCLFDRSLQKITIENYVNDSIMD